MNINAILMWVTLALGFHLFGKDWMMGLFIGLVISFIAGFLDALRDTK